MNIDSIEIFHLALPWKTPQQLAGRRCIGLETILVRMRGGGAAGWGEASPGNAPLAAGEWAAGVFCCLRDWLAPAVLGGGAPGAARADMDPLAEQRPDNAMERRLDCFRGNRFAKAALDMAWWDLSARRQNRPLYELLDADRRSIEIGPTFDQMQSIDQLLAAVGGALDAGYARVKLMFRPGWDVEMLRAVRQEFPTQSLHIDCAAALGLGQMEMLCRLDDFQLAMIEQPLAADDLVGHAMMQENLRTSLCLAESITTPEQADLALELHSCRSMNLLPGRVGGLTAAVAIHDACRRQEVSCWVGAVPQSVLGARFGLALAAKANCTYPADWFFAEDVLAEDLAEPLRPVREADGTVRVPLWSAAGSGIEPDATRLKKFCLQRVKITM